MDITTLLPLALAAEAPATEAGFPLLGWLALLGAGALGLLTLVLWLRYARMSRTS